MLQQLLLPEGLNGEAFGQQFFVAMGKVSGLSQHVLQMQENFFLFPARMLAQQLEIL
ncbi:MAG: hypothetical protein IJS63_08845 [Bacteroidaceae bacterium]|nr:hypothetical protein [Bacteroidaceae bacterium]